MRHHAKTKHTNGTVLLWLGVVSCVVAMVLFYLSCRPVGFSKTITEKNEDGVIKKSIACGELVQPRFVYLLPFVPGIILIVSGRRMRSMANDGLR
jgi:hypothetical protein